MTHEEIEKIVVAAGAWDGSRIQELLKTLTPMIDALVLSTVNPFDNLAWEMIKKLINRTTPAEFAALK